MGLKLFEREPRRYNLQQNKKINRKSRFRKWLYRVLFLILLILLLLQFQHYSEAIEGLAKFNANQANLIHTLDLKVQSLQMSNAELQTQVDVMQVKMNGIDIHNQLQDQLHTVNPIEPSVQDVDIHNVNKEKIDTPKLMTPTTMITTAAVTIMTVIKGIGGFIPVLP